MSGNWSAARRPWTWSSDLRESRFADPVVHWEIADLRGEAPMEVDGDTATATIGPFPPDTLDTRSTTTRC